MTYLGGFGADGCHTDFAAHCAPAFAEGCHTDFAAHCAPAFAEGCHTDFAAHCAPAYQPVVHNTHTPVLHTEYTHTPVVHAVPHVVPQPVAHTAVEAWGRPVWKKKWLFGKWKYSGLKDVQYVPRTGIAGPAAFPGTCAPGMGMPMGTCAPGMGGYGGYC